MSTILCFDLETVPDIGGLRRLRPHWADLSDEQVAEHAFAERRERTGSDFLPLHLHRIVAIGCAFRDGRSFQVRCLGAPGDGEARLIADFFRVIDKHTPQLVSWNGGGFDLPVLHYRALMHGIAAPTYWDLGESRSEFRYNNYISRYHLRHTDLMDLLALYQGRAAVPLDELAKLCGLPGKLGMDGSRVWEAVRSGQLDAVRAYCETDVVNTYLLYVRFRRLRGQLEAAELADEETFVRDALAALDAPHWREYLDAWRAD